MTNFVARFVKDESGATAIEYGLIAMLISVAVIGVLQSVGSNLGTTFSSVNNALSHSGDGLEPKAPGKTVCSARATSSGWASTRIMADRKSVV